VLFPPPSTRVPPPSGVKGDPRRNPYEEASRPPIPWNFFLVYAGAVMYFMSYSLEAATGSLTLLYFNSKGWGSDRRDYLYVAAMCTQAAMPIYAAPLLGACQHPPLLALLPTPPLVSPAGHPVTTGWYAKKYYIKTLLVFCQVVSFFGCLLAAVANRRVLMLLALNMMAISGYSTQPVRRMPWRVPAAAVTDGRALTPGCLAG
jgi:hypothetical protein